MCTLPLFPVYQPDTPDESVSTRLDVGATTQVVRGVSDGHSSNPGTGGTEATDRYAAAPELTDTAAGQTVRQPTLRVFQPEAVVALKQTLAGREKALQGLAKLLEATSADKRLALQPDDWRAFCQVLQADFPNFAEVIEFISHQMALSACKQRVFALSPMLLIGPPGTRSGAHGPPHWPPPMTTDIFQLQIMSVYGG
jgi:hypothetical protein